MGGVYFPRIHSASVKMFTCQTGCCQRESPAYVSKIMFPHACAICDLMLIYRYTVYTLECAKRKCEQSSEVHWTCEQSSIVLNEWTVLRSALYICHQVLITRTSRALAGDKQISCAITNATPHPSLLIRICKVRLIHLNTARMQEHFYQRIRASDKELLGGSCAQNCTVRSTECVYCSASEPFVRHEQNLKYQEYYNSIIWPNAWLSICQELLASIAEHSTRLNGVHLRHFIKQAD